MHVIGYLNIFESYFVVPSCIQNHLGAQIFLISLLLFSTCFGQTMCPSSGENTVLSGMQGGIHSSLHTRQSSI